MKTSKALLFSIIMFVCSGCSHESPPPTSPTSNTSTIEGTVTYFAGGGTVEMPYPEGFVMMNCQWITSPPDSSYERIYLVGKVDSSFIDKHVHVVGTVLREELTGSPPLYHYAILRILVDTLKIM